MGMKGGGLLRNWCCWRCVGVVGAACFVEVGISACGKWHCCPCRDSGCASCAAGLLSWLHCRVLYACGVLVHDGFTEPAPLSFVEPFNGAPCVTDVDVYGSTLMVVAQGRVWTGGEGCLGTSLSDIWLDLRVCDSRSARAGVLSDSNPTSL